jgi:hypothetical protein
LGLKRGLIFTIDALIALSIFIGAVIAMYSYFNEPLSFGISGVNIYSHVDNYFTAYDNAEELSRVVRDFYLGKEVNESLKQLINQTGYDVNLGFYVWNGTSMKSLFNYTTKKFDEYFIIKKYLVLTVDDGLSWNNSNNVNVSAPSSLAGRKIKVLVNVSSSASYNNNLSLSIEDKDGNVLNWNIEPSSPVQLNGNTHVVFNVSIPSDAMIGEYLAVANLSGSVNEIANNTFNVIKFGFLKIEVGI